VGSERGHGTPKVLENIVSLRFEKRFSKQNSVIRLIIHFSPPNFWAGYATVALQVPILPKTGMLFERVQV